MKPRYTYEEIISEVFSEISEVALEGYLPYYDDSVGSRTKTIIAIEMINDRETLKIEGFSLTVSEVFEPKKITYTRTSSKRIDENKYGRYTDTTITVMARQEDGTYIIDSQETSHTE